jgi:ABC-type Fe3+-hydroxamate transport system substrate-binding protein
MILDDYGNEHHRATDEPRIISLVPSITELLFALGLGNNVVGRTGFCIHPRDSVKLVPKIGGTKDIDLDKLISLQPTHVIVNIDENTLQIYQDLCAVVDNVIVTHPNTVEDNPRLYLMLGEVFGAEAEAGKLLIDFEEKLQKISSYTKHLDRLNVLYLIWRDPWMTVSKDTYISHMLKIINCQTVPGSSSIRYPSLSDEEICELPIDACLLSTEPYTFRENHVAELELKFNWFGKVHLVDGEMVSWYGSRAILGLEYLSGLSQILNDKKSASLWA